jgi:hypothetical protein
MPGLIRFGLLALAAIAAATVIAAHGIRGLAIVVFLVMIATLPRSRPYQIAEYWLVRMTGSRRRAAVIVMSVIIALLVAFNVYELTHF